MTVSRRLEAHRQAVASAEPVAGLPKQDPTRPYEDEEDDTTTSTKKDKEKDMTTEVEKAKAEGHEAGFEAGLKTANDRMNAVFSSEHYAGREQLAHTMLGKKMSAEDIIEVLASAPKIEAVETDPAKTEAAAEAAARDEAKKAIAATGNSNLDATGGSGTTTTDAQASSQIWDKAVSRIFPSK